MTKPLLASLLALIGCMDPDDTELESEATSAILYNLERPAQTSASTSDWWRSPVAHCTPGNALYGMGMAMPWYGNVESRGMLPDGTGTYPSGAKAAAQEGAPYLPDRWDMTAYAVCGRPLQSQTVAYGTSGTGSSFNVKNATAWCPGDLVVIGAGGTIYGGNQKVKVDEIRPNVGDRSVTVYASEDTQGTSDAWSVQAIAICAARPAGYERVATSIEAPSTSFWNGRGVYAVCPGTKKLLSSAGGFEGNDTRSLRVYNIIPSPDLRYTMVKGTYYGSLTGVVGRLNAYAICADP